ncbi:MAG: ion channel [Desulfurococcales archaeon]|nr:ion channel [Desulfurococcales archaeon]
MVLPVIYRKLRLVVHRLARRRFLLLALIFSTLWILSALLFYIAEHERITLGESFYWALITMATVGYGDIVPTTTAGRVVAGLAAVFGIAVYTLFISTLADYFLDATVRAAMGLGVLRHKKILVVGEGPVCDEAVRELVANGYRDEVGWLRETQPKGRPPVDYVVGGLDEEDLERAGLEGVEHVIVCYEDDSKNLHAAALVKSLNPKAKVTVLAKDKATMRILKQMGVDSIVPMSVLGRLLASTAFEPAVTAFISDATSAREGVDLSEQEATGMETIEEIEKESGARVVAVIDPGGNVRIPKPGEKPGKGEKIVLVRRTRQE